MDPKPDPAASAPRRVEAYLDQVLALVPSRLSPSQRDELRRELREHLWSRIEAYEELGQSQDAAITEALTQFGGGQDFLKQWRRGWAETPPRLTVRELWEATRLAFRPTLIGLTASFLPFVMLQWYCWGLHGSPSPAFTTAAWAAFLSGVLALPMLVGARQGMREPERVGVGMVAALTLECSAASLLCRIGDWAAPDHHMTELLNLLMTLTLAWVPVAGGAAAISGWLTRRARARRIA